MDDMSDSIMVSPLPQRPSPDEVTSVRSDDDGGTKDSKDRSDDYQSNGCSHVACTIPIGCEDSISLFFLMAADKTSILVALASTTLVWITAVLFIYWLDRTVDDDRVQLYNGSASEWAVIISILSLQVVPIGMTIFKSLKDLHFLRRFICKLQPGDPNLLSPTAAPTTDTSGPNIPTDPLSPTAAPITDTPSPTTSTHLIDPLATAAAPTTDAPGPTAPIPRIDPLATAAAPITDTPSPTAPIPRIDPLATAAAPTTDTPGPTDPTDPLATTAAPTTYTPAPTASTNPLVPSANPTTDTLGPSHPPNPLAPTADLNHISIVVKATNHLDITRISYTLQEDTDSPAAAANTTANGVVWDLAWWRQLMYLWFCWFCILVDTFQPLLFVGVSIYVAFYWSNDDGAPNLLSAILNVVVLTFIATLDTVVLKAFLELRYGSSSRICVSLGIQYTESEEKYWENRAKTTKADVVARLHTEEVTTNKKWEALICADSGLGILGNWDPSSAQGLWAKLGGTTAKPTVNAVNLLVALFSWDQVCAHLRRSSDKSGSSLPATDRKIASFIAAASNDQWAYEIDQAATKLLLLLHPALVERFTLKGTTINLANMDLDDTHMKHLGKMLQNSPNVKILDVSDNPKVGDEGMGFLANALERHDGLDYLNIVGVNLTLAGVGHLTAALNRNPRVLSGGLGIVVKVRGESPSNNSSMDLHKTSLAKEVITLDLVMALVRRGSRLTCFASNLTPQTQAELLGIPADDKLVDVVSAGKRLELEKKAKEDLMGLLQLDPEGAELFELRGPAVSLSQKGLTVKHVISLSKMLMNSCSVVEELDLSNNPRIGDEGVKHLAKALQQLKRLNALRMKNAGLTDSGFNQLLVATPRKIAVLDLSGNNVGDAGIIHLLKAFEHGKLASLKELHLDAVGMRGRNVFHYAAERGRTDLVESLLSSGNSNVFMSKDEDGETPHSLAYKNKHEDVIKILTKAAFKYSLLNPELVTGPFGGYGVDDPFSMDRRPPGASITSIKTRTGDWLDGMIVQFGDECTQSIGGQGGGENEPLILQPGEDILEVSVRTIHDQFVAGLSFKTSKGQSKDFGRLDLGGLGSEYKYGERIASPPVVGAYRLAYFKGRAGQYVNQVSLVWELRFVHP